MSAQCPHEPCGRYGRDRDGCNCLLGQRWSQWQSAENCTCPARFTVAGRRHFNDCTVSPIYASVIRDVGLPPFLHESYFGILLPGEAARLGIKNTNYWISRITPPASSPQITHPWMRDK